MAMWSTQPLEEMSTRYISWGVKSAGASRADKHTTFNADCLEIWIPQPLGNLRASPEVYMDCCTCTFT